MRNLGSSHFCKEAVVEGMCTKALDGGNKISIIVMTVISKAALLKKEL